jgi:nifR3 family TIM-barrel protein
MPKITAKGKGAALMRDVPSAARILRAMRRALTVPLTIKIRSGWDDEHVNAVEVARMAESEGVDALTVHPRTRAQRHAGEAPREIIARVVEAVGIPVTGNGDVRSMAEARRMMTETGCESVMIGRGALGRPWVFSTSFEALPPTGQRDYRMAVIRRHCALIREHFRDTYALIQTKKHLAWYAAGLGHATECRAAIFRARTIAEAREAFERHWDASEGGPASLEAARCASLAEEPA